MLSGHGPFNVYYDRFALREGGPQCICEGGEDDVKHVLLECRHPKRERARQRFKNECLRTGEAWPPNITEDTRQGYIDLLNIFAREAVFNYEEQGE